MPELPEVETIKRTLEPKIGNRTILGVHIQEPVCVQKQKFVSLETFKERIPGNTIQKVERRGKFLYVETLKKEQRYYIIIHFAMTGKIFVVEQITDLLKKDQKHAHLVFELDNGKKMIYCDHRKFGGIRIFTEPEFYDRKINDGIQTLGPEYTWTDAETLFLQNVNNRKEQKKTVKEVIMDQKVIAGIGNIYACEVLFRAGIYPARAIANVTLQEWKEIFKHTCEIFDFAISVGGSSISDYVNADGNKGSMQNYFNVYEQKACAVCETKIEKVAIDGRSSYFCPKCQT